ncbi:MAG: eukaryotic-like serine/threonine-protein kinase [Chloroflexota bacterium]|nr:eukaryotic-like serine/threonine-protein kinase [Chloroflexota bacterium]
MAYHPAEVGGTIGKYEVRGALGSGAYGTVYLGWQEDLQRPVAIKELGAQMVSDPAFLEGFREEARIMALLDHPNCVKVFDFIELGGRAFLVSEFVDGASLRQVVVDAGSLTPQQALGVLKGSITGLGHAHHLGLTHRDVKPENILADREGTSKLADFGQAYFGAGPGAAGALTGSPPYMSPEQARGGVCDARSDLYSAGCILYEFLTGRPPFLADNAMAVMRMQVSEVAVDPRKVNKKLPKQATKLMARALAKDPAARFQSADEMLSELEDTARAGYGKNWEQSAAIKGLVAASAAGAAVAAGAVGVAAAGATAGATGTAAVGTTTVGAASTTAAAGGGISGTTIAAGAGVAALAGAAAVAYVVISNAVFGHNLVTNGNAEQGSGATTSAAVVRPNGWTTTGNFTVVKYGADVFPSASDPGPPDRGDYFFAGGNGPTASASQTLDVSGGGGAIDSGGKKYTLSAWLGGYGGQNDNATVEATFLSANGQAIGTPARIGPVTDIVRGGKTALKLAQTTGEIPKGTRKVLLKVLLVRTEGNYNDGYADDITFSIS